MVSVTSKERKEAISKKMVMNMNKIKGSKRSLNQRKSIEEGKLKRNKLFKKKTSLN